MEIIVNDYKEYFGGNVQQHSKFERWIKDELPRYIRDFKGSEVEFYNMKQEYHTHKVGTKKSKLVIFNNASLKDASPKYKLDEPIIVGDYVYQFDDELLGLHGGGEVITSNNGIPIAEFFKHNYQLNILYDVMKEYNEENINLLKHILISLNDIFKNEVYENSWKNSKEKDRLKKQIQYNSSTLTSRLVEDLKSKQRRFIENVESYKIELKRALDNLNFNMKQLSEIKDDKGTIAEKIIKDLDLILGCDLIDDIHLTDNNKFDIFTKDLIITDDKGRRFKGGRFEINLDIRSSYVKFKGSLEKKGYWSDKDPHPHISKSGNACLGNVSSTIAELCSQNELYALTLLLLDFLQSANTKDPAGENVKNWQQIDEDGNEIETEYDDEDDREYDWTCDCCDNGFYDEDEIYTVYGEVDEDGNVSEEHYVCGDCRERYYTWDEDLEEYIHD